MDELVLHALRDELCGRSKIARVERSSAREHRARMGLLRSKTSTDSAAVCASHVCSEPAIPIWWQKALPGGRAILPTSGRRRDVMVLRCLPVAPASE